MWDNVPLLRNIANGLIVVSLLLLLLGMAYQILRLPIFPLRAVELAAAPQRVSVELLEKVAREQVIGNFFSVDLAQTRQQFEKLPWVRKVNVRRKFPERVEVEIEEHVALAIWNNTALVNTHGEVFEAERVAGLPQFNGQPDTAAQMAQMYTELNRIVEPLSHRIVQLSLSPRFAWQAKLDDGMVVELGREEMLQRMTRFVAAYPYGTAKKGRAPLRVDLRYRNGFTLYQPGREV